MKKLVLLLSFVFALGLFSVNAQVSKKEAGKTPAKTEKVVRKKTTKKVVKLFEFIRFNFWRCRPLQMQSLGLLALAKQQSCT